MSAANVTTLAGMPVNFTATIGGAAPVQTTWWWGDGTTSTSSSNPVTHTYANPGIYLVYAQGTDGSGNPHDNLGTLLRFAVLDSYANDALGNETQVQGSIVANATTTTSAAAVLAPGQWVQVSNWVTNLPTNPQWTPEAPSYTLAPSAKPYVNMSTILGTGLNLSAATLSWSSSTPEGSYALNFSVPDVNPYVAGSGTTWNNYTFTIFVSPSGSTPATPVPTSPHNATLEVYQEMSWFPSFLTLDPALASDAVDGPILQNIYQTLIVYNGSKAGPDPSDFVPDLATCVPGSTQCVSMYGRTLVSGDNWTFVINPNATFYNGTTGASWSIYPNDVAFSFARSCALANSNFEGFEDFVLCQALLPSTANSSWDGGTHAPWNNTPANILNAMTVNSSLYCTTLMQDGIHGNGCITLDTSASGRAWPEFLEFVESTSGWAVTSCSWAASEGLGLPGWFSGTTCYPAPPGSSGNPNPTPGNTAWDSYELSQRSYFGVPTTALRYHALGSGPYYLVSFDNVTGYTLKTNPDWGGTSCQGGRLEGCLPGPTKGGLPPNYIPTVVVHFEVGDGPGLAAMAAGDADLIDTGGNDSVVLSEAKVGELDYLVGPSITLSWQPMQLNFNTTAAAAWTGAPVTLPANASQDLNFRQFLINSYPYATAENKDCIIDGILYCFSYGGAIPVGMANYYPTNITWPITNPDTNPNDPGSAAWWWSKVAADSMVGASCTASTPCTFPLPADGVTNNSIDEAWAQSMAAISHGAIQPRVVNLTLAQDIQATAYEGPSNTSFPIAGDVAWAPDFFDPFDYTSPFFTPGFFSWLDSTGEPQYLPEPQYLHACSGPASDPTVTTGCQGTAYEEMLSLIQSANVCAAPVCSQAQRALLYNMAERIVYGLGLEVNTYQTAAVYAFAPWIDASSLLLNPTRNNVYGGVTSDQPFFFIQYATSIPQGYLLDVALTSPGASPSAPASPAVTRPAVESSGGAITLEAGETFLTLVSVTGGTGIYDYIWSGLPMGCVSANSAVLACRPTQGGDVSMSVTVVDSKGDTGVSNAIAVVVVPRVSITSFVASPANVVVGGSVSFSLSASGGIGPLSYDYLGLPAGCTSANVTTFTCTPTATGSYSITAGATDTVGIQAFDTLELNVTTPSHPSPFLGLPDDDGYFVIDGLAVAAIIVAAMLLWRRRPSSRASSEDTSQPSGGAPSREVPTGEGTTGLSTLSTPPGMASGEAPIASHETAGPPSAKPTATREEMDHQVQVCPACGATNRSGARFCDQCSTALST